MRILIVGGGSAGWMTAACLAKRGPGIEVTLLESTDVPTIGVGEATIPTIKRFNDRLELSEKEWMPACNASFKFAIRFKDWRHVGADYWHPFETIPYFHPQFHLAHYWYRNHLERHGWLTRGDLDASDFYEQLFVGVDLLKQNKILKHRENPQEFLVYQINGTERGSVVQSLPHAYHFDAGLYGDYLKTRVALPGGVTHIVDHVERIERTADGGIGALHTSSGRRLEADLFVDCTGFASLLLGRELAEPFESYADALFCDRAVTLRIPFADQANEQWPFTLSAAMKHGWSWRIALLNRIGAGYVYCSRYTDEMQADEELRNYLGIDRCAGIEARYLKMRVGKHRHTWVKNCVAIGLSAGFIEPLESTGLELIQQGAERLTDGLARGDCNAASRETFNRHMTELFEEVRDFVTIHYALTNREDTPFWRDVKYDTKIGENLAANLNNWKRFWPNGDEGLIFGETSWMCILHGMGMFPTIDRYERVPPQDQSRQIAQMQQLQLVRKGLAGIAVPHHDYLMQLQSQK